MPKDFPRALIELREADLCRTNRDVLGHFVLLKFHFRDADVTIRSRARKMILEKAPVVQRDGKSGSEESRFYRPGSALFPSNAEMI